uniref:Uncharacterized protein n=1 Tax=Rhizophora mucronata TaxID=61149 RepID=A0A2P2NI67_RHIMU
MILFLFDTVYLFIFILFALSKNPCLLSYQILY